MYNIQSYSYHNHTTFSDGSNTLEEMVEQAQRIGFSEMGISDHLIVHKNMEQSQSWEVLRNLSRSYVYNTDFKRVLPQYQRHCDNIRKISQQKNMRLLVGFEVDFFTYNGWFEELQDFLHHLDYDYLISGNHFFCSENGENIINIDCLRSRVNEVENISEYIKRHFIVQKQSIESGMFAFLAHMDYIRKLGDNICGPMMYFDEKCAVLNALQQQNAGIEISTKGLRKIGDFYPSDNILTEIAKRKLKVVISDDAHVVEELGLDYEKAEKALQKFKINTRLKL